MTKSKFEPRFVRGLRLGVLSPLLGLSQKTKNVTPKLVGKIKLQLGLAAEWTAISLDFL